MASEKSDLQVLLEHSDWLAELARNPADTLRTTVKTIIAVIIVGGTIDIAEAFVNAILAVGDAFVSIPESVAVLFGGAGAVVSEGVLGAANWYVSGIEATAASLGPFGIFIQVGAYVGSALLLVRALPPLLTAVSDLLGSVPVVGSVLDAALTFGIELADSFGSIIRSD